MSAAEPEPVLPLWEVVRTAHLATRRFTEVFAGAGLTPAQFGVLASLDDGDDLSQADLARAVLVRPQSMNRLVADMVAAGLVRRDGPGGRGRRAPLAITAAGQRAVRSVRPAAYAINQPDETGLSARETAELVRLLTRVHEQLEDTSRGRS